jgi:hypothetical protein
MAYSAYHIDAPDQTFGKIFPGLSVSLKGEIFHELRHMSEGRDGECSYGQRDLSYIQPGNKRPCKLPVINSVFCFRTCTRRIGVVEQSLIGLHDSEHLIPPSLPLSPCFSFLPTVSSAPSSYTPQPEAFLSFYYFHIILLADREGPTTLFMQSKWPLLLLRSS